jgi:uncharacterized membrane protein
MVIKLTAKSIFISSILIALVIGFIVFKLKPFSKATHTTDSKAVATCQKSVETTYSSLLDTASLMAPATTNTIQKQEQEAKTTCVTTNTH